MTHARLNKGFLAEKERRALAWMVCRLPGCVTPNHLTAGGVVGAVVTAAGFIASHISNYFVAVAVVGLFINWFGDSLDGTLARYRKTERPNYGYFIDHSCDLIAQTFIIIGLGFSPFFTLSSSLFVLSAYMLTSFHTYLKVMIARTHHLSYRGMGATEFRILVASWGLLAAWAGPRLVETQIFNHPAVIVVIGVLWGLVFVALMWIVRCDLLQVSDPPKEAGQRHGPDISPA